MNFYRPDRSIMLCFNPCFNGSSTLTRLNLHIGPGIIGLNPCFNGSSTLTF